MCFFLTLMTDISLCSYEAFVQCLKSGKSFSYSLQYIHVREYLYIANSLSNQISGQKDHVPFAEIIKNSPHSH